MGLGWVVVALLAACAGDPPRATGTPERGYPSVGYVGWRDHEGAIFPRCSGVLVAPGRVVTAAHCLERDDVDRWWFSVGEIFTSEIVYATTTSSDPEYVARTAGGPPDHDVAVLQLGSALSGIAPATLAEDPASLGCGYLVVGYSGYGDDDWARRSARMCLYEADGTRLSFHPDWGVPGAGVACDGDSGGAVLDATGALAGVTSFSDCASVTVAMRVDAARAFIDGAR